VNKELGRLSQKKREAQKKSTRKREEFQNPLLIHMLIMKYKMK
jgi:hypothetical protein